MRYFIVAFLLINTLWFVQGDFSAPKWVALRAKCVEITGLDVAHIDMAKQGQFTLDESFKMYLKCLMDEESLWHADGTVNVEAVISVIPEKLAPIFEKPIRECCDEVDHDPEQHELAYKLAQCVYRKTLDKFDMP